MTRRHSFFMLLQGTPRWRALDADERLAHHDAVLMRVFEGYPDLQVRRFESTAFAARCSDVLLWETDDVAQYHEAIESLRACGLLDAGWFDVVDVIAAVEEGGREPAVHPLFEACVP